MPILASDFITKIRLRTDNDDFSEANGVTYEGIPQSVIVDFINEAQDFIQTAIVATGSTVFDVRSEQSVVANQETYTIDDNVHLGNKIRNMEYTYSGEERDYRNLPPGSDEDTSAIYSTHPRFYMRRGTSFLLRPIPEQSTGKVRATYPRQLDEVGLRAGQLTGTPGDAATEIELDDDSWLNDITLGTASWVCIVDNQGVVQDYAIPVTSYDSTTRIITIPATDIVGAAGDYVVVGKYMTSHISYPSNMMERYVKLEAQMRVLDKDSSVDAIREGKQLARLYAALIEGHEDEHIDEVEFPYLDEYIMT